jgi:hypothetical protein
MTTCFQPQLVIAFLTIAPICVSFAGPPAATSMPNNVSCDSPVQLGEVREVKCAISGTGNVLKLRFTVSFLGGHDDTMASLKASEDGNPTECEKGSKTNLVGEDGEVSLFCNLSLLHEPDSSHALEFTARWTHAQYKDFELTSE